MDGVDDHLQTGLRDAGGVRRAQQGSGVRVEDAGGELQIADLPGEGSPVLLACVDPVQLALAGLREVGAPLVEEHDVHGVRHPGRRTDHDPAGAAPRGLLPRHRQRNVLQVPYVDGAGLQRRDDGPLERSRTTGVVAGRGDGRALLQRRGVRARKPYGEFRSDLHVEDAGDAARPEQMGLPSRLPDHRGVDEGARLNGLEGVDPDVALDDRFLADEALVPDDGAVLDPGSPHDVGVLADHAATQITVLPDVDVVVDDGLVQEGAALHDDIGTDDGVLADFRIRFDLRVVPDVKGTPEHGVRVDLGAFRDPYTGRDLEAVDLDVDLALQHVGLRLDVALVRADVLPVALGDIAVDRLAFLHELGEDVTGPVDGLVRLDIVEYLGLHHIDARVDGVGEDLPPGGLLQEALDLPLFVDNGDAEFERIGHAGQAHRDECALLLVES